MLRPPPFKTHPGLPSETEKVGTKFVESNTGFSRSFAVESPRRTFSVSRTFGAGSRNGSGSDAQCTAFVSTRSPNS